MGGNETGEGKTGKEEVLGRGQPPPHPGSLEKQRSLRSRGPLPAVPRAGAPSAGQRQARQSSLTQAL